MTKTYSEKQAFSIHPEAELGHSPYPIMAEPSHEESFDSSDGDKAKTKAIYTESSDHDGDGGPPREGVLRQIWTSEFGCPRN